MSRIELGNPKIRKKPKQTVKFVYKTSKQVFLPTPSCLPRKQFFSIIVNRRSRREFCILSTADLSNMLWFTCKTFETARESSGVWQHRCTPSAGGIHPIDILVFEPGNSKRDVFVYEPISHSLLLAYGIAANPLERLLEEVNKMISVSQGTLIWFVAQFEKTLSRYDHGESLVWRDSGALLSNFYTVAEALNLNCCGLGATGDPYISQMFGRTDKLRGVGGCLLGTRSKRR